MDEWMVGWMDGWVDGWMDGWMMDRYVDIEFRRIHQRKYYKNPFSL